MWIHPAVLTSDDLRRIAGGSVLAAHGRLTIPLTLQFTIGQAPFYIDGPHERQVVIVAAAGASSGPN